MSTQPLPAGQSGSVSSPSVKLHIHRNCLMLIILPQNLHAIPQQPYVVLKLRCTDIATMSQRPVIPVGSTPNVTSEAVCMVSSSPHGLVSHDYRYMQSTESMSLASGHDRVSNVCANASDIHQFNILDSFINSLGLPPSPTISSSLKRARSARVMNFSNYVVNVHYNYIVS